MVSAGAPGEVRLSTSALLLGRAAEQLALAGTSVVMAARLGPEDFAPVGVLLVLNSLALTLADLGLGVRVLRLSEGSSVDRASLTRVRAVNLAGLVAALLAGALLGDGPGRVVAAGGILWCVSAEATARKAAALRWGATARVATSEVAGAAVLLVAVAVAWLAPSSALLWVAAGLAGKQLVEGGLAGPWRDAFAGDRADRDWLGVWVSQALAFAIGNIDYVAVGVVAGERALSVYVVAYRLANAVPSQAAFVAGRAVTVDLASGSREDRQDKYERYTTVLFGAGVVGAGAMVAASPVVAAVLGTDWTGIGWALAVLAIAAPWRTVLGTAGTLALISGGANRLMRWEVVRLVLTAGLLVGAALLGFVAFLAAVVVVPVASTVVYHRLAGQLSEVRPWRHLGPASLATLVLLIVALVLGSASLSAVS